MISLQTTLTKSFSRRFLQAGLKIRVKNIVDLLYVWVGSIVGALAGMIAQMIIARALGTEDYGIFSGALGFIVLAASFASFGSAQYWLKVFGDEGWGAMRWIKPSFNFLSISTGTIIVVVALWAALGPHDRSMRFVILALSVTIVSYVVVEIVSAKYQLEQNYAMFSALGAVTPLLRLIVAVVVLFAAHLSDRLRLTVIGYVLVSLVVFGILVPQLRRILNLDIELKGHGVRKLQSFRDAANTCHLLSHSWVFGIAGLLYLAWSQGHIIIAKYALGDHEAGLYSAALVILNAVCLLPTVAFSKFLLPKIHRWAAQDFQKLKVFSHWSSLVMFGLGGITAAVLYFGSGLVIRFAFGGSYAESATILQILSLTIPMRFLGYNAGAMLRTKRYMQLKIMILTLAVAFNILLTVLLVPRWGVLGLAATVSMTEFLLVMAYVKVVKFHYFKENRI